MPKINTERVTAIADQDFVVFLIGMRKKLREARTPLAFTTRLT